MGWKIDTAHEKYKVYRMKLAADKVRKGERIFFFYLNKDQTTMSILIFCS